MTVDLVLSDGDDRRGRRSHHVCRLQGKKAQECGETAAFE